MCACVACLNPLADVPVGQGFFVMCFETPNICNSVTAAMSLESHEISKERKDKKSYLLFLLFSPFIDSFS